MSRRFDLDRQFDRLYRHVAPAAARSFGEDAVHTAAMRVWRRFAQMPVDQVEPLFAHDGEEATRYLWRAIYHAFLEEGRRESRQPRNASSLMGDDDRDALDGLHADASADVAVTALALADLHRVYRKADDRVRAGMLMRLGTSLRPLKVEDLQNPATIRALVTDREFEVASAWYFGERDLGWFIPEPASRRSDGMWASTGKIAGMLVLADNVILDTLGVAPRVAVKRAR
jgi:hypothetical protein